MRRRSAKLLMLASLSPTLASNASNVPTCALLAFGEIDALNRCSLHSLESVQGHHQFVA